MMLRLVRESVGTVVLAANQCTGSTASLAQKRPREGRMINKLAAFFQAVLAHLKEGWLILAEAHSIYGNEDGRPPRSPVTDKPTNGKQEDKSKTGKRTARL